MIFQLFKKLFLKARKYPRYHIHKGSFVVITPNKTNWKVQVIDMSLGGAAFIYQGNPNELSRSGAIKLFDNLSENEHVDFRTIFDIDAPGCSNSYRRRGVEFKWGDILDKCQAADFIKEYGLCAC